MSPMYCVIRKKTNAGKAWYNKGNRSDRPMKAVLPVIGLVRSNSTERSYMLQPARPKCLKCKLGFTIANYRQDCKAPDFLQFSEDKIHFWKQNTYLPYNKRAATKDTARMQVVVLLNRHWSGKGPDFLRFSEDKIHFWKQNAYLPYYKRAATKDPARMQVVVWLSGHWSGAKDPVDPVRLGPGSATSGQPHEIKRIGCGSARCGQTCGWDVVGLVHRIRQIRRGQVSV
jgi:hypothetical protein